MEATKYSFKFLLKLYKEMLLIRSFEENLIPLYGERKIRGFCHLYIGQEGISTGSLAAINLKEDYVIGSYRDHGIAISAGMDIKSIMAELYGKKTGCSKGKGGSMHLFDIKKHMYGGHGIVGGQIPLATGMSFKIKYKEEKGLVLCFLGDGAIHMGSFHESLNMAKLWSLPIIYICENNLYGMGTHINRISSVIDLSQKSKSYGIESWQTNGMDVLEVYESIKKAAEFARRGEPIFIEMLCYRYRGHSMSDPARYRKREEVETYKEKDPIILLKQKLLDYPEFILEEEKIKEDIQIKIKESIKFAEESSFPNLDEIYDDIL